MAIQKRPKLPPEAASLEATDFIMRAPDAPKPAEAAVPRVRVDGHDEQPYEKGIKKGNKRQISLTIAPDLLRRVDELARRTGQGRAAVINLAIWAAVEGKQFGQTD